MPDMEPARLGAMRSALMMAQGNRGQTEATLRQSVQLVESGKIAANFVATGAVLLGNFDIAGKMLLRAYREKDGRWIYPLFIRLPEQGPDSGPWQEFWRQSGTAELAELRRSRGLSPDVPGFGDSAKQ